MSHSRREGRLGSVLWLLSLENMRMLKVG